ncbi:MAG TPA: hypothetical protein VGH06_04275, partial [Candidatus Udaeobacter sp.]
MLEESELQRRMVKIQELVTRVDSTADVALRAQVKELVQSIMDLHGVAIERVLSGVAGNEDGINMIDRLADDPLIASVLLLHGLHPRSLEERVERALEKARPILLGLGTDTTVVAIAGGALSLKVRPVDNAFASRSVKSSIATEIYSAAPDITSLEILGLEHGADHGFVPLEKLVG